MINRNIVVMLSGRDAGLARTLGAAAGEINLFQKKVEGIGSTAAKSMLGFKTAMQAIAVVAAVAFGYAVVQAAKFQAQMANVQTVMHASKQGIQDMSDAVLTLGTKVPQTTTTLTKGLYNIASSGFYGADALNILEESAKAATAGLTNLDTSGKAITAVLNAYGLQASDAKDVSDILFKTVELGVFTFDELTTQIGDVIPAAATAGVKFDEVGSAMAAMSLSGLSAAESATSLNRLIRSFIRPSADLNTLLHQMGYESGASALKQDGLYKVMEKVRISTGGSIIALSKLFPEIRAGRGAFALMVAGGQNYARTQEAITNKQARANATQKAFNIQMKATGNQFKLLVDQANVFGIRLGTAFLPVVTRVIQGVRQMGAIIGNAFQQLASRSKPTINALGDAVGNLSRMFTTFGQVVGPVLASVLGVGAAAASEALKGLGRAVSGVAGVLADHPDLVRAVAIAYTAYLIAPTLEAAAAQVALQASLLSTRLGLMALAGQEALGGVITGVQTFAAAIAQIRIGNFAAAITHLRDVFGSLGAVLTGPVAAGVALIGGLFFLHSASKKADDSAKGMIATLEKPFNMKSIKGMEGAAGALSNKMAELDQEWEDMTKEGSGGNRLQTILAGTVELLTPMPNKILNNAKASAAAGKEFDRVSTQIGFYHDHVNQLTNELGVSEPVINRFAKRFKIDLTKPIKDFAGFRDAIRAAMLESEHAPSAASAFADAVAVMADPLASATDKVKAFQSAIETLFGTALSLQDASIGWQQGIDDLTESVKKNGRTLDINTQKGRDNAKIIDQMAKIALDASTTLAQSKGLKAGADALTYYRQNLYDTMIQLGFTKEQAQQYLNTIGLTPENLKTLVEAVGVDKAILSIKQYRAILKAANDAKVSTKVELNTKDFDGDMTAIGLALVQINQANPQATAYLDGKPFHATAEQLYTWVATFGNTSTEATALLNMLDPEHKFNSLAEMAAAYGKPKNTTVTATDNASPTLDAVNAKANALNKTVTVVVNTKYTTTGSPTGPVGPAGPQNPSIPGINAGPTGLTPGINAGPTGLTPRRRGGRYGYGWSYHAAAGGVFEASLLNAPTVYAGERATGGEAFIPRRGNPTRSMAILGRAAGWYGMELKPQGAAANYGGFTDMSSRVTVHVHAKSIMDGATLISAVQHTTRSELEAHDRRLLRALKSR